MYLSVFTFKCCTISSDVVQIVWGVHRVSTAPKSHLLLQTNHFLPHKKPTVR